jgi:thiol-disulfide isomerase/thioredoxin
MKLLITALLLTIVGLLVWKLWAPTIDPPKAVVPEGKANLYFFYTDWCGFSQKAMPEWTAIEKALQGTSVTPTRVDCEDNRAKCSLYGIEGYPTVILESTSGTQTYSGRITKSGVLQFLRGKEGVHL